MSVTVACRPSSLLLLPCPPWTPGGWIDGRGAQAPLLAHPDTFLAKCACLCHRFGMQFGTVSLRSGHGVPDERGAIRDRYSVADGYALRRVEGGGVEISRGAWAVFVPEHAVSWAVISEPGIAAVIATCTDCSPPRQFENLTALRSHQRHKHDQSRKRTD